MTKYTAFKKLHENESPLLIGNIWNVLSAKSFERAGYAALGTSSAAVAHALGYEDGENMTFDEYLYIVKRICACTNLPVSVDLEAGYGTSVEEIIENIKKLHQIGVVGINIEDSHVKNGERVIEDIASFSAKMAQIISFLKAKNIEIFVNVRTDVFLLNCENALEMAKERIDYFQKAGADGVFLPCLTDAKIISELAAFTHLPLNLMAIPDLPDFATLKNLGIKRISSGNFLNSFIYRNLERTAVKIVEQQNFSSIFINA